MSHFEREGYVQMKSEPAAARWPEVLVVMPSLVEDVKVAPRSGMVVAVLKNGNAVSFNPDVVRRLAAALASATSSSEPAPNLAPAQSGWAGSLSRLMARRGR